MMNKLELCNKLLWMQFIHLAILSLSSCSIQATNKSLIKITSSAILNNVNPDNIIHIQYLKNSSKWNLEENSPKTSEFSYRFVYFDVTNEHNIRLSTQNHPIKRQTFKNGGDYVRNPEIKCNNQTTCDAYDVPLVCSNGYCTCEANLCWIYSVHYIGFRVTHQFTCGTCGQLGSQCQTNICDPPGTCKNDKYCHCDYGTANGPDICVVNNVSSTVSLLLAGLLLFLLLGLFALSYTFFANYRSTGYFFWCRNPRAPRLRGRRNRRNVVFRPSKSPAFTQDAFNRVEEIQIGVDNATTSVSEGDIDNKLRVDDEGWELFPENDATESNLDSSATRTKDDPYQEPSVRLKTKLHFVELTASTLEVDVPVTNDINDVHNKTDTKGKEKGDEINSTATEEERKEETSFEDSSGMSLYFEENMSKL